MTRLKFRKRKFFHLVHSLGNLAFGRFATETFLEVHFIIRLNSQDNGTHLGSFQRQMLFFRYQCSPVMTYRCLCNTLHAIRYGALQTNRISFHENAVALSLDSKKNLAAQPRGRLCLIVQYHHLIGIAAECLALHDVSFALATSRHTPLVQTYFSTESRFSNRSTEIENQVTHRLIASKLIVRCLGSVFAIETFVTLLVDGTGIQSSRPERHLIQSISVSATSVKHGCRNTSITYGVRLAFPKTHRIRIFPTSQPISLFVEIVISLALKPIFYLWRRICNTRKQRCNFPLPNAIIDIRGQSQFILILKYLCICRHIGPHALVLLSRYIGITRNRQGDHSQQEKYIYLFHKTRSGYVLSQKR